MIAELEAANHNLMKEALGAAKLLKRTVTELDALKEASRISLEKIKALTQAKKLLLSEQTTAKKVKILLQKTDSEQCHIC